MKKILGLMVMIALSACTATHQGTKSLNVRELHLRERPLNVSVVPGEKIYGTAQCTYLFGIPIWAPAHRAYGAKLDTSEGNFAGDSCTAGAFYQAIVSSDADVIISPQYRTSGTGFLCLPWIGCLYRDTEITVSGYKGTYQFSSSAPGYVSAPSSTVIYHNQMP